MGASMFRALQLHPNKAVQEFLYLQNLSGRLHLNEARLAKVTQHMVEDCVHFCLPGSPIMHQTVDQNRVCHLYRVVMLVALSIIPSHHIVTPCIVLCRPDGHLRPPLPRHAARLRRDVATLCAACGNELARP